MSSSLSRISLESRMSADKSTTTRWLYTFQNSSTWKGNPSRSTQRGTNLNLLHEGLSVQIHRGRGRFRSRGRAEFRANSDWNVRNERQLSRNRSYRIFVFKLRGEEGRKPIDPATSGYRHEIVSADRTSCLVAEEDRLHRECYWCASPPPLPRVRLSVGCWFRSNYGWDTWI